MLYPFYEAKRSNETNSIQIFIVDNFSFPPHLHSYVELIYVIEGLFTVSINENTKKLQEGDIAVSFSNDIHSFNTDLSSKTMLIIFSPEIISGYLGKKINKTLENPFIEKSSIDETTISLIHILFDEFLKSNNEYIVKGLLYSILGKLDCNFKFKDNIQSYNNTIQNLLKYIESHYSKNITLESISRDLGYSKFHISRLFTKKLGYQFNEYVNRLRINMAERLLIETDMSILNISIECGFESHRNFNRVFKEFTGLTPSSFKKQNI
ncbi:multiple antibiotic resistance protein MarA [Clostridium puniceum]|uniref:Multiple antibiotic resistance protein MarA n=1 Tax=Clostridium puniceum TaxID=29367 RepID=A0A1S8TLZ4_9CLOT|nr:AraC family transcriptional regulator [Clostridium puniceum]OOM78770.1 multiple antibiotic resistance protein MarA [Clostridium puniceum]